MKFTLNVLLAVVLFCSVAFAADPTPTPTPTPPGTGRTGDMGNGGRPSGEPVSSGSPGTSYDAVIISVVRRYLGLSF